MTQLIPATLIKRLNRFTVLIRINGAEAKAHLPNSGRMEELLVCGAPVMLRAAAHENRKTPFDLQLVRYNDQWVSVDSHLPNRVIAEALSSKELAPFSSYDKVRREFTYRNSRLDFYLEGSETPCLIEVKSVNLVVKGTARFPDAPTPRGSRHLEDLIHAQKERLRSAMIFLIQREDAQRFSPHKAMDPVFAGTLKKAQKAGVELYAYTCAVHPDTGIQLKEPVTIHFE